MLSETGLQADKVDATNKRTFLLYSPVPQMANVTKTNKNTQEFLKEKYISCTQNVQPMFVTENENISLHTQPKHAT